MTARTTAPGERGMREMIGSRPRARQRRKTRRPAAREADEIARAGGEPNRHELVVVVARNHLCEIGGDRDEPTPSKRKAARASHERKSTRLNSSHIPLSRMPSSA